MKQPSSAYQRVVYRFKHAIAVTFTYAVHSYFCRHNILVKSRLIACDLLLSHKSRLIACDLLLWVCYIWFILFRLQTQTDKRLCVKFGSYLRDDGVFLLRILLKNSHQILIRDIINGLWDKFLEKPFVRKSITETRTANNNKGDANPNYVWSCESLFYSSVRHVNKIKLYWFVNFWTWLPINAWLPIEINHIIQL